MDKELKAEIELKVHNAIEFGPHDIIECRLLNNARNLVTDFGLLKYGEQIIQVHPSNLKKLLKMVATKDENHTLKVIQMAHAKKRKREEEKIRSEAPGIDEDEIKYHMGFWLEENNPHRSFRDQEGYDFPPITTFTMLNNLGPKVTDQAAKQDKDFELHKALLELLKTNQELMQQTVNKK